jgi:hypothetical protein
LRGNGILSRLSRSVKYYLNNMNKFVLALIAVMMLVSQVACTGESQESHNYIGTPGYGGIYRGRPGYGGIHRGGFGGSRFGGSRFGGSRFGGSRFGGSRFGGSRFGGSRFGGRRYSFGGRGFGGRGFSHEESE